MDRHQTDTFAFMIAVTCLTAPMAASMVGYIAHYNFALSGPEIRIPAPVGAVIIAVVIATLVAIYFFVEGCASHDPSQARRTANRPNGSTPWRATDKPLSGNACTHSRKSAAPFLGWCGFDRPAQSRNFQSSDSWPVPQSEPGGTGLHGRHRARL